MLGLNGTQITDAGLRHLEGLKKLRYLSIARMQVTKEGARQIGEKLPDCEVEYFQ
jgi:hypothetical protein